MMQDTQYPNQNFTDSKEKYKKELKQLFKLVKLLILIMGIAMIIIAVFGFGVEVADHNIGVGAFISMFWGIFLVWQITQLNIKVLHQDIKKHSINRYWLATIFLFLSIFYTFLSVFVEFIPLWEILVAFLVFVISIMIFWYANQHAKLKRLAELASRAQAHQQNYRRRV